MSEIVKVILLGILEGITEFLPISSTGHLILAGSIVDLPTSLSGTFEIAIQLGAVLAVLIYYARSILDQVRMVHHDPSVQRWWLAIVVASVPAAVLGLTLGDFIQETLFSPVVVAIALIVGGAMFLFIEHRLSHGEHEQSDNQDAIIPDNTMPAITIRQAITVGLWQVLALIPGMSRSGMSIVGGMIVGLPRTVATMFSFYLALPVLGGATVYTLLKSLDTLTSDDLILIGIGLLVSGIVAWISIGWLLRYIARNNFVLFGYYRIAIGVIMLGLIGLNVVNGT